MESGGLCHDGVGLLLGCQVFAINLDLVLVCARGLVAGVFFLFSIIGRIVYSSISCFCWLDRLDILVIVRHLVFTKHHVFVFVG